MLNFGSAISSMIFVIVGILKKKWLFGNLNSVVILFYDAHDMLQVIFR